MRSGIRDNYSRGSAADFLKRKVKQGSHLSVVSAYFTSLAYARLSDTLDEISAIRLLFGEPRFIENTEGTHLNPPSFSLHEEGLNFSESLRQSSAAMACAHWIRDKAEIKSIRQVGLMHGKLYHVDDGQRDHALVGSSNFTIPGLGLSDKPNIELNLVVDSDRDRTDLLAWFNEIWNNSDLTEDVRDEVLEQLERFYRHNSPEFVYFKTLYHIFGQFLAEQVMEEAKLDDANFGETQIWNMLYSFQRDGVKAIRSKLDRFGGCILADSVGLGKTYTALAVIKWFELRNQRVLVLCPKKLRDNWTEFLAQNNQETNPLLADRFAYTVMSHTDLTRTSGRVGDINLASFNWGNYDLVVIDESHNFRTASRGKKTDDKADYKPTRYEALIDEVIGSGIKTKVLMLSATPVNNDLSDLKAQLDLILERNPDAFQELGVNSVSKVIGIARRKFRDWLSQGGKDRNALIARLPPTLFSLLDGVTIARSRRHVERHYASTMDTIGHFPKRARPRSVFAHIDTQGDFPSFAHVHDEIASLHLALYNPLGFVHPKHVHLYDVGGNFDQANRERFLIGIIKTGLLKRLESSVSSFGSSMERLCSRIDVRLADIEAFQQREADVLSIVDLPEEVDGDADLEDAFEVGGALKYKLSHMNIDAWATALKSDRDTLARLQEAADRVKTDRDAKLMELIAILREKFEAPTTNRNGEPIRKAIIFTAYSDTAQYLYDALQPFAKSMGVHSGLVTGGGDTRATYGRARYQDILTNFAPRAKKRAKMSGMPQDDEIDLLIATDCISEGQNLQDADLLINFDIHWNPVRLIQRFGRIDRIGSLHDIIHMVNFWPTPDLNHYINLRGRVEARMALADLSATGEDNILKDPRQAAEDDLKWRDRQLLRLKDEVLDLEDEPEVVTLAEFSLEDFRADLLNHSRENQTSLEEAPMGINAVVPAHGEGKTFRPGVIFCLKRKGELLDTSQQPIGRLDPFFLIHVQDDGSIRNGYASPKAILDVMRSLCLGRSEPLADLCAIFDRETKSGQHMEHYDALAKAAVADIRASYAGRALSALTASRSGKIADAKTQPRSESDFELVTWLIIKPSEPEA